jgi:hypothetical protein
MENKIKKREKRKENDVVPCAPTRPLKTEKGLGRQETGPEGIRRKCPRPCLREAGRGQETTSVRTPIRTALYDSIYLLLPLN